MADFSMWGAEASPNRLIQRDAQDAMLRAAQIRQANSAARENEVQTEGREFELEGAKKMSAAMAGMGQGEAPSGPASLADPVEQLARAAYQSGLGAKGADFAAKAALIRSREAALGNSQATAAKTQLETHAKALQHASRLYEGVSNQQDFDRANALYAYTFGAPAPAAGAPYSPELVGKLRSYGMTQLEAVRAKMLALDTASKDANRKSSADFREFRKGIIEEELDLKKAREDRLAKAGGKGVTSPTVTERKAAESMIAQDFPDLGEEPGELALAAHSVASRARALRQGNKSLDADTALRQALAESKASGDFTQTDAGYSLKNLIGLEDKKTKFDVTGKTPDTPLDVPMKGKVPDLSTLKAGRHYNTPKGVMKFLGGDKWAPAGKNAPKRDSSSSLPAVDEEDDDE